MDLNWLYEIEDTRPQDFDTFFSALLEATSNIDLHYFQLPVAGREEPIYRERVYCYELYHQLRSYLPTDFSYKLDGELDKVGHPIIHKAVGPVKPDFLVHERGEMNKNLVVIEVKPINASVDGVRKDITTLCGFLSHARYYRAIYLVYGNDETTIESIVQLVIDNLPQNIPDNSFFLLWHQYGNSSAEVIFSR
ncbi:MAG: methionyl-tRNA formyltransferase-like protein [Anaerolineales bacterium]|nr:methionyl-tRNA formyltransferase-like protein [Anaerolineales bacterium]